MFHKLILQLQNDIYKCVIESIRFEDVAKGRKGAIIVSPKYETQYNRNYYLIPIVRTTTKYNYPAQIYDKYKNTFIFNIINEIQFQFNYMYPNIDIIFNNAMVELYDTNYKKMGFHTDQELDIEDNSYICLFSCYENNSNNKDDFRTLTIKNKETEKTTDIELTNKSVIIFSTDTNNKHLHKIILNSQKAKNKWIGITFRLSKTFIHFIQNKPFLLINLEDNLNTEFKYTDDTTHIKEFLIHKSNENKKNGKYNYPIIDYTISKSDTFIPL